MQSFEDVVKQIEDVEHKVDLVLKAARLERHPKEPMSKEKLNMVLSYVTGVIAMIMGFSALYMVIYFMGTYGR